jgi:hypothetical protein
MHDIERRLGRAEAPAVLLPHALKQVLVHLGFTMKEYTYLSLGFYVVKLLRRVLMLVIRRLLACLFGRTR